MLSIRERVRKTMKKPDDRRSVRTEKALKEALQKMLLKKPLEKITIRVLTDEAGINRATFYAHYDDIYDLYHSFEKDLFDQLTVIFEDEQLQTYEEFYAELLDYMEQNKDVVRILFANPGNSTMQNRVENFMIQMALDAWKTDYGMTEITPELEYDVYYRVYGLLAMVRHWIHTGFSIPLSALKKQIAAMDQNTDEFIVSHHGRNR
jgi:AcrR family transcriptional regulator